MSDEPNLDSDTPASLQGDSPGKPEEVCRLRPLPSRRCDPTVNRERCALDYRQSEGNRACTRDLTPVKNRNNGEESDLVVPGTLTTRTYAGNYTKGMRHNDLGEVEPQSDYVSLLKAVDTQEPAAFEDIPTAFPTDGSSDPQGRRYVDPQAGVAYDTEGPDAPSAGVYQPDLTPRYIRQAPRFSNKEFAAEIAEVYAMALLRDKAVNLFSGGTTSDNDIRDLLALLSNFADYRGPVDRNGQVTPQLAFRGGNVNSDGRDTNGRLDGSTIGPLVSQFLVIGSRIDSGRGLTDQFFAERIIPPGTSTGLSLRRDQGFVTYGTLLLDQRQNEIRPGLDFMQKYEEWLFIQRGGRPTRKNEFTGKQRFVYSLRQLANYVHFDQTFQEYLIAALLILSMQERANRIGQDIFDPGSPYAPGRSKNQEGFVTFGNGHVLALLAEATTRALKAAWNGKWFNQRRLRPETAAGRIHNTLLDRRVTRERYNITGDLLDTAHGQKLLERVLKFNEATGGEGYLLPQAFPEGSPMHPSYPAGHATQAGACVTILKALFNEDFEITDGFFGRIDSNEDYAYEPNDDGTALRIYKGPDSGERLTVRGEVNKLAANVSIARNMASVHYRIDYAESVQLGEYVALGMIQEMARSFNPEHSLTLTLFNGTKVRIEAGGRIVIVS